jgi:hypothetical protein
LPALSIAIVEKFPTERIEKEISEDLGFCTAWEPWKYLFFVVINSTNLENAELLDRFSKPQVINEKR